MTTTLLQKNLGYCLLASLMLMALSLPSATRAADNTIVPIELSKELSKGKDVKTPLPLPAPQSDPKPEVPQPTPTPTPAPQPAPAPVVVVPAPVPPTTEASTTASTTPPTTAGATTAATPPPTGSPTPEKSTYIKTAAGLFNNRSTFLFSDPTSVYRTNHLGKNLTSGLFGLSALLLALAGTLYFFGGRRLRSSLHFTPGLISHTRIAS